MIIKWLDKISTPDHEARLKPESSNVFFITLPTPILENNDPDLSYIKSAIELIAPILEKNNILILESTVPVGTTEIVLEWIKKIRPE